ncbi:hypothetical protein DINM_002801 [Dirofilaria immitis]|nr:hypothetical protein [Dirofilaria immitis]
MGQKELKIATSNELPKLEADALKNLSNIYQAIGDYSNAAILLDKYCDMISNQGIDVRIGSLRKLAELYQKSNQLEKAEMTLLKNLKLAKRVGAYTLIIDVHADMYQFYRVMQRKDEAREHWDEAQQIYLENKIDKRQALIIEMTGDNYFNCGSYEEAIDAYNRCLMLVQEDDNLRKEAELCNKLGTTHWLLYHPDEALAYYQQSLSVYQQISDLETLNLTSEINHRRERGLIYGYIAECYVGMNDKPKALFNFCKQIPFFDDINDIEGKCEMLRHLIEGKRLIKDANWIMQICKNRIELSHMGSIDLQIEVLKESAEIAESLAELWDACQFLEKAIILCIANKCSSILNLAIIVFRECLDAIEIYSHEQLSILFQLGKMELEEGLINDAIAHIMDVKERCQDKVNYVIETIEDIAMKTDSLIIHRILDESCLYDLLNHEKLSKISAIHWMMTRGDFITAKHFFDLHKNIYQNTVEYIADMALFYWNEQNFEECAKFLEEYLSYYFEKDIVEEEYDELSLIRSYSRQRIILDFLHIILILCKYMLHVDAIEIITIAEIKFWRGCQNKKPFIEHNIPTKEPEIGILYAGIDSANILWEYVCPNDRTDFICKTRVSSLVIIDFTKVPFDVANIINSFSNNDIVILLNNEADDTIINFRIANARCLLDIKQQSVESLMPFLEKLINGYSVEECSELLQFINVRLFGDRSSKVRSSLAQHTRKMIIDNEDGLLENLTVSEDDQKKLITSKDIYDHTKDITLLNCCEIDDHLQQLFVQETHNEQNFILKLIKHLLEVRKAIFTDHLYGIYDDVQITKLDNLEELTKSLANNIRVTRKKTQETWNTWILFRGRNSISENTDSEAVVVDVEFQEPE